MQVFKITQEGIKEIKKKVLVLSIPLMAIACAVGIIISTANETTDEKSPNVLPITIIMIALLLGFSLYRNANKQKKLLSSYTLTIANNLITRQILNAPTISLYFNDITEITKFYTGTFIIKGKNAGDKIVVPPQINDYQQLETTLAAIQPITVKNNISFLQKYPSIVGLAALGLLACVYLVENKIIVAVAGIALIIMTVWAFIKIMGNRNIDKKAKRGAWWMLLVLAVIIMVMFSKLTRP